MTETPDDVHAAPEHTETGGAPETGAAGESAASPPPSPHKKHSKTSSRRKHDESGTKKKDKKSKKSKSTSPEEPARAANSSETPAAAAALGSDPESVCTSETDTDDQQPQTSAAHRHRQSHAKDVGRAVTAPPAPEQETDVSSSAVTPPPAEKPNEEQQQQQQQEKQQEEQESDKKEDKTAEEAAALGKDYAMKMAQYDRTLAGKERATSLTATLDAARVRSCKRRSQSQQQAEALLLKGDASAAHTDTESATGDATPAALSPTTAAVKKANRATRIGFGGLVVSPQGAGLAAPCSGPGSETSSETSPDAPARAPQKPHSTPAFPYTKKAALGAGLQGRTARGTSTETGAEVAIKDYDARHVSLYAARRVGAVGARLRALSHENVARVLAIACTGARVCAAEGTR